MSNLYKQRYVVSDGTNTRIINSNTLVEEKMEELARQNRKRMQNQQAQPDENGFVAGIAMEAVDVVPKEESISMEELLERKNAEANEILNRASQQAEEVVAAAREQSQAIRTQAQEEGYQQGLAEGRQQAQTELEELQRKLDDERATLEENYQQQLKELEPKLVDVIADVFEQVFHVQFDDKKEILLYLIQNTILGIEDAKEFQIKVGVDDFAFLEEHKEEIQKKVGQSVRMEFMADAGMKSGQCVIETDSGVFDCGRDVQLENLIKTIRSLSLRG